MDSPAAKLLRWYDAHARVLPWREASPDPYRVWLSEIMLQQTTTTVVAPYYLRFLTRWPDVVALAGAADAEVMSAWAGLGYYARARNLLACARMVRDQGGRFPDTEAGLRALPGIGAYTAAAIASIAFDLRAVVVDGNVERVVSRLFAIETPLPASRPEIRVKADDLTPDTRPGDFAQAMMDLGATICTPTRPACILCPLRDDCLARSRGIQDDLPRKMPKAVRPMRFGTVFVAVRNDGAVLVGTRPERGLLAGMSEFPGVWPQATRSETPLDDAPISADWRYAGQAFHGFTHLDLELAVYRADNVPDMPVAQLRWIAAKDLHREAFPTLMRKIAAAANLPLPDAGVSAPGAAAPAREPARMTGKPKPRRSSLQTVRR